MTELRDAAMTSKAWPFEEARRLLKRYENAPPEKGHVLFETGYGPSGLPHIGTFGEVLRTTMVRRAFEVISDIPTRLICFSDDMDGMRKVPGNVPNQEMLREHLQKPLTIRARPVRRVRQLRRTTTTRCCAVPRHVRVRVRVLFGDRVLCLRAFDEILLRALPNVMTR
jgi:lysyl-tRNA synthetase class I